MWMPDHGKTNVPIPQTVFGYKIIRLLGEGGGSFVYEARDENDERVALKHLVRVSPKVDRYIDEAQHELECNAHFNHPSIRKVLKVERKRTLAHGIGDMIKSRGLFVTSETALIMEYVEGDTLTAHPISNLVKICDLLLETAKALEVMHKAGYIHADVNPRNILHTRDDKIKLIDRGLSCPTGTIRERIHDGTPGYVAPEQVLKRPTTPRTDIYSFGATMYRIFTTRKIPTVLDVRTPTGAALERPESDLANIQTPRELNPTVPPALSALVMECINRKPDQRPSTIGEVHNRLGVAITQIQRAMNTRA